MAGRERVLVTGASGFLGACLTRALVADGHDVHVLLRDQAAPWRLAGLAGRLHAHHADLRDAEAMRRVVRSARPEAVYHLATHGVYPSQQDRAAILATNLLGTANLLDALDGQDYRSLVTAGTGAEYGPRDSAIREDEPLAPRTDYAVAKAAATLLCQAEGYKGRPVTTVRIFAAYGPWEEPTRLVPYVMGCCLRGETPRVSAGTQLRDFIHADDVVALLRLAADQPRAGGCILHAGTGRVHSVRELIESIVSLCGCGRVAVAFGAQAGRPGEPPCYLASVEQTARLTGWQARYDLRAGIERTWAWFTSATHARAAA